MDEHHIWVSGTKEDVLKLYDGLDSHNYPFFIKK